MYLPHFQITEFIYVYHISFPLPQAFCSKTRANASGNYSDSVSRILHQEHLEREYHSAHSSLATSCLPITSRHCLCGDPGTKEQIKPRRVLECRDAKTRPLLSFPPPCCNYSWNSITCLPSYPRRRTCLIQSANDLKDPIPLLVPWV